MGRDSLTRQTNPEKENAQLNQNIDRTEAAIERIKNAGVKGSQEVVNAGLQAHLKAAKAIQDALIGSYKTAETYRYNAEAEYWNNRIALQKKADDEAQKVTKQRFDAEFKNQEALEKKKAALADQLDKAKTKKAKKEIEKQQKQLDSEIAASKKKIDALGAETQKIAADLEAKIAVQEKISEETQKGKNAMKSPSSFIATTADMISSISTSGKAAFGSVANVMSGMAQALEQSIDNIASSKSKIDTRLQGWTMTNRAGRAGNLARLLNGGSYWDQMSKDMIGIAGVSRYITQKDFGANISSMVEKGIAANVEQRAFLATISDKIATTFNATNGTLLRLVRIQEQDTTASRLGMEAALNSFLNNMYETTEYMGAIAEGVKTNLEESMALMSAKSAVGYEYQVQKWLGSLYSVGLSQTAVSGISSAFGSLSAGKIEGIAGGGAGNLMVMAANNANLSIADLLAKGMDESSTNQLMQAMVDYLAKLYNESKDSRVVQQQIANVYGLSASDLKAAASLSRSTGVISNNFVNYNTGISTLAALSATMGNRIGMGEQMKNVWDNLQYSMAAGIASNPALYGIYKVAGLMRDTGAQMNIPAISYLGTMVDLETSVADLMSAGALAGGLLSNIGNLATAFAGNLSGAAMLASSGALWNNSVHRGSAWGAITASGATVSESGMVGNASSSDVQNKTMNDANDDATQQLEEQQDESEEKTLTDVNESVLMVYELLQSLVDGTNTITVKQELSGLLSAVSPFE